MKRKTGGIVVISITLIGNTQNICGEVIDNSRMGELDVIALNNPEFLIVKKENGIKVLINKQNILYILEHRPENK